MRCRGRVARVTRPTRHSVPRAWIAAGKVPVNALHLRLAAWALQQCHVYGCIAGLAVCGVTACASGADKAPTKSEPAAAAAADAKEEFRTAKREIQARLRNKQPFERIAALRQVGHYPTVDAAKLVVGVGLKDDTPEVRSAAYDTLLDFKDDPEIARYLLLTVSKETRRGSQSATALPLVAVLLASNVPGMDREVTAYLERQGNTHEGLALLETLADELGDHGQAEDVPSLAKLTALKTFHEEFGLRRAVVQALVKISASQAIGQLISILEKVQGEIRGEILKHLTDSTGEEFGLDSKAWSDWWKDNEKTFQMNGAAGPRKEVKGLAAGPGAGGSMYYGLRIYAQKLVFIIDTSGSMMGPRLAAAKRELLQAVDGLSDDTQFSIVAFNSVVYPWQKQLVPANSTMKQAAARWINALEIGATTASYDALEAGLRFDAEAIYFLTDGAPHGGKVSSPPDIVTLISRENYTRRLSIYTIGIDAGPAGGLFDEFLAALARQNWGVYRRVDQ